MRVGLDTGTEGMKGTGPNTGGVAPRTKAKQRPKVRAEASLPLPACTTRGGNIPPEGDRDRPRGRYRRPCLAERRREVGGTLGKESARTSADLALRTGKRPTHTPVAKAARHEGNLAQRAGQAAWEEAHAGEVHDPAWCTREVLPGPEGVSLTNIARATGMSTSSASKVRAGRRVPHPRHWAALEALSTAQ